MLAIYLVIIIIFVTVYLKIISIQMRNTEELLRSFYRFSSVDLVNWINHVNTQQYGHILI